MIYRETHTSNYTVYPNTLINAKLPSDAKNVLTWLLSKPKHWKLIKIVISETLALSKHRVQKAVTILKNLGYLCFFRHKDGSGHWDVYESPRPQYQPQTRVVKPSSDIPTLTFQTDLTNTDYQKNTETTTDEPTFDQPIIEEQKIVVVSSPEVEQPAIATPDPVIIAEIKKLPVKQAIKPTLIKTLAALTLIEAKAVLTILSRAIVLGKVQNPVGYTVELAKRAKNGTLSPITANEQLTLSERMAQQEKRRKEEAERGKINNQQWVALIKAQYGIDVQI